jgi:hypothetical protein
MARRSRSARRRAQAYRRHHSVKRAPRASLTSANGVAAEQILGLLESVPVRTEVNRAVINRTEINRANASRSTGPRTPEGKAASRGNAFKHGLFARSIELVSERLGEDRSAFEALQTELIDYHQPQSPEESMLVERIAAIWWLLGRLNTQSQRKLERALEAGSDPVEALAESAAASPAEASLERSLMRAHRNLVFLQKWHTDRRQRREVVAMEEEWAAEDAYAEAIIQDGLRRARERDREQKRMESEGREMERLEPQATADRDEARDRKLRQQSAA